MQNPSPPEAKEDATGQHTAPYRSAVTHTIGRIVRGAGLPAVCILPVLLVAFTTEGILHLIGLKLRAGSWLHTFHQWIWPPTTTNWLADLATTMLLLFTTAYLFTWVVAEATQDRVEKERANLGFWKRWIYSKRLCLAAVGASGIVHAILASIGLCQIAIRTTEPSTPTNLWQSVTLPIHRAEVSPASRAPDAAPAKAPDNQGLQQAVQPSSPISSAEEPSTTPNTDNAPKPAATNSASLTAAELLEPLTGIITAILGLIGLLLTVRFQVQEFKEMAKEARNQIQQQQKQVTAMRQQLGFNMVTSLMSELRESLKTITPEKFRDGARLYAGDYKALLKQIEEDDEEDGDDCKKEQLLESFRNAVNELEELDRIKLKTRIQVILEQGTDENSKERCRKLVANWWKSLESLDEKEKEDAKKFELELLNTIDPSSNEHI
jgi:hypothetical protein